MQDFQGKGKTEKANLTIEMEREGIKNTVLRIKVKNLQDKVAKLKKILLKKAKKENIKVSQDLEHFICDYLIQF